MNSLNYEIRQIDGEDFLCIRISDIKRTRSVFKPPSLEMVRAYCKERKNQVDPVKWWNFYNAKGWKIGKTKMVQWKSAVVTWEDPKHSLPEATGRNERYKLPDDIGQPSENAMTHEEYLATLGEKDKIDQIGEG